MKTIIEPFRIKTTEPIHIISRQQSRDQIPGYRITYQAPFLRHFTCHFETLGTAGRHPG
ncbi:MAG: hypothetical protein ACNA7H_04960 [Desulfotignum sp.]